MQGVCPSDLRRTGDEITGIICMCGQMLDWARKEARISSCLFHRDSSMFETIDNIYLHLDSWKQITVAEIGIIIYWAGYTNNRDVLYT